MRELGLSLIADDPATPHVSAPRSRRRSMRGKAWARACRRTTGRARSPSRSPTARAPADLIRPGRLLTLRAVDGGVLARRGHTEAAVDLARMAGLKPAGVICEIMNEDGTMARMPELERFAAAARPADPAASPISSRTASASASIRRRAETVLPTRQGRASSG